LTRLLDLLSSLQGANEDSLSISLSKKYQPRDLSRILPFYSECVKAGIGVSVTLDYHHRSAKETIVSNFRLRPSGTTAMLESIPKDSKDELSAQLAIAKSVEHTPPAFAREFDARVGRAFQDRLALNVFVAKAEITKYLANHFGDHSYEFWLSVESFKHDLVQDPRRFLRRAWSGKFPVVIALDLTGQFKYEFCLVSGRPKKIDVDYASYDLFAPLAKRTLEISESAPFVLALTFAPSDDKSSEFAILRLGLTIDQNATKLNVSETQYYDFKERVSDVAKTVASFANACGGLTIYGLDNEGNISGLDRNRDSDQVSNSIATGVSPLVRYEIVDAEVGGKFILAIVILPPKGGEVFVLNNGTRPFRFHSTTKYYRYDSEVRRARAEVCGERRQYGLSNH
jgi:hypothetical protein